MIDKFQDDKLFVETDEFIVILDGVITNKKSVATPDLLHGIIGLYKAKRDTFFNALRGSFAGAFVDKAKKRLIVFSDQLGQKFVYYSIIGGKIVCAEDYHTVYDELNSNGVDVHLDPVGAELLLSYGFMLDDYTILEEIRKIQPGHYVVYDGTQVKEQQYYILKNEPDTSFGEEDAVEQIDYLFRNAVRHSFEKDDEYGYNHVVALSGGLDSRMTSFVAHHLGYTKQLNITFSQTGYYDHLVPQRMAAFLKHEWLFKALDNGIWLYDIDEVTKKTGGNVLYYGIAHGNSLVKYLDFSNLGIAHSGQMGDVTISVHGNPYVPFVFGSGAYSKLLPSGSKYQMRNTYPNMEIGLWYNRYLNGTNYGIQYLYNKTETLSPFLDLDYLEFALSIPYELRKNHYIYKKWILEKYPDAADFEWEKIKVKINAPSINIRGRHLYMSQIPQKLLGKFKKRTSQLNGMNPYDLYLAHNSELKKYLMGYFDYSDCIHDMELREYIKSIKEKGNATEIIQAVSLLAAIKLYSIH